jgi:hypothetical protein
MMKFSKFRREKRSLDPNTAEGMGPNKDILLLDRKTDMEANFVGCAVSGEEIYWDVNSINNGPESILKGPL